MKKLLTLSASAFMALALVFGVSVLLSATPVQAAEEGEATTTNTTQQADSKDSYNYVAQPTDTYTQMARKAVQTYGVVNKVKLSQAQIIAAETNLTIDAGSPVLVEGQKVSIDRADVKTQVEAAQKLSAEQQAAWQAYNVGVDFNTDNVGQAK